MVENLSTRPTSLMRFRRLYFIVLLLTSLWVTFFQKPVDNSSALEIPMSLLVGPALSLTKEIPVDREERDDASFIEIIANQISRSHKPINGNTQPKQWTGIDLTGSYTANLSGAVNPFASMNRNEFEPADLGWGDPETDTDINWDKPNDPEDQFSSIIAEAAGRHQVDPAIIMAIIKAESGYNPKAVSKRGAKGLMQLMPDTAKELGVNDSFCPRQNIHAGVKYFKQLLEQFKGDTKLALAAYNAGSRKVKMYRGIPPFQTTRIYIKKVFEYHKLYQQEITLNG